MKSCVSFFLRHTPSTCACRRRVLSAAGVRRPPPSHTWGAAEGGCRCGPGGGRSAPPCGVVARQDRSADAGERFFGRSAQQGGIAERKAMIDREHNLPITKQADVLCISRGSVSTCRAQYRKPTSQSCRVSTSYVRVPFRRLADVESLLVAEGCKIGRRHVKTLMKRMGIRRSSPSAHHEAQPGHKIYPYLLRATAVTRPNQVWAMDITYIPMARGFVYLAVVLDWFSRRVLSWRLSITMEAASASRRWRMLWLVTASRTSSIPIRVRSSRARRSPVLANNDIAISMDGKGAWRDNVFVERLWRSVKYEEVYLKAYDSVSEARSSIGKYLDFYNGRRPHSSLDGTTPDQAYFNELPFRLSA